MTEECELLVTRALASPLVRSLVRGLQAQGCQFDLARHVVCEPCHGGLAGGYDLAHNQVLVCSNISHTQAWLYILTGNPHPSTGPKS